MTPPDRSKPRVTGVLMLAADPASTITEIRLTSPLTPLVAAGRITLRSLAWHECRPTDLDGCDLMIGQRPISARHLRLLQAAHGRGAAVVVDVDDLLTQPAPHLLSHATLARQAPWVLLALDEADRVSVSTPRLAAALAAPGREIRVVPNYASPLARRVTPTAAVDAPATVLLAASDAVAAGPAFEALRRLQAARGAQLRLVAVGPVAASAAAAGLVVEAQPLMPRERFLAFAVALPRAVAVIPLDDSAFSASKSAVKWFDFAAVGLPTLMSDRPPYSDVVEHGHTGWLLPDHADAWTAALARALDEPALRERIANAAEQAVHTQHSMARCTEAWRALVDEIDAARAARQVRHRDLAWPERLLAPWQEVVVAIRRANRARLARRQQRPGTDGSG
jgi:hypothetical protein